VHKARTQESQVFKKEESAESEDKEEIKCITGVLEVRPQTRDHSNKEDAKHSKSWLSV
jgi:hypothetical protein